VRVGIGDDEREGEGEAATGLADGKAVAIEVGVAEGMPVRSHPVAVNLNWPFEDEPE
jgi:hypothetical protein